MFQSCLKLWRYRVRSEKSRQGCGVEVAWTNSTSSVCAELTTSMSTPFMDSPIITRLFRQLFTHRACQSVRSHSDVPFRIHGGRNGQTRCLSSTGRRRERDGNVRNESHWQQRMDLLPLDMSEEYQKYPMVTADQLRGRRERPKRVKMLTRDFIEGRSTHLA